MTPRTAGALFSAALSLAALSGCAPARLAIQVHTLDDVNASLAGRTATIRFTDGGFTYAEDVTVAPDTTLYRLRHSSKRKTEATDRIARITIRNENDKTRSSMLAGMAPGLLLAGYGGIQLNGCESDNFGCGMGGLAYIVVGSGAAILGGFVSGIMGSARSRRLIVYNGRLARYMNPMR